MTKTLFNRAKCGCIIWMEDNPKDQTKILEFEFDESKCVANIRKFISKDIDTCNQAVSSGNHP